MVARSRSLVLMLCVVLAAYWYSIFKGPTPSFECPVVNTTLGSLVGRTLFSREGREYFEYRGIPFAKPPVGELRFEPPQPPEPWSGIRDATSYGSDCPQMSLLFGIMSYGDEDCLFLNVNTPARNLSDPSKRLPVMVWIYGGMFMEGKSSVYGGGYFMDEDIVLVTLNYRVGALGFLNTNDALIKGNMGLKDQNMALQWVQQNIKYFGGNENDVTIVGQSAGAASVHYHMLSPLSKGLFHKAISQSGVAVNPWAINPKPREQAFRLGNALNCPNTSTAELVSCLKKASVADMLQTYIEVLNIVRDPLSVYVPTVEAVKDTEAFVLEHPYETIRKGRLGKIPWMTGVTSHEGFIASATVVRNETLIAGELESWKALAANGLYYHRENPEQTEKIKQMYFGNASSIADIGYQVFFKNLTTLFSDRHFFNGFQHAISAHAAQSDVYVYFYNYLSEFSLTNLLLAIKSDTHVIIELIVHYAKIALEKFIYGTVPENPGACHADEVSLFFDMIPPVTSIRPGNQDYEMSRALIKLWASFARTSFTPGKELEFQGTKWQPINVKDEHTKYLHIDNEVKIITNPFEDRLKFWESLDLL